MLAQHGDGATDFENGNEDGGPKGGRRRRKRRKRREKTRNVTKKKQTKYPTLTMQWETSPTTKSIE
tara:strand:- start:241 stop:438 length:198 start_codon:yes stop_codon:yes gene_type:complete